MINNAFHPEKEGVLTAAMCYQKITPTMDSLILIFSKSLLDQLIADHIIEDVGIRHPSNNEDSIIYRCVEDPKIGVFLTRVGAPATVAYLEELSYRTDAKHFLVLGSCGTLDPSITEGKIIVPEKALREEGTSYHYVPANDWIQMKNASKIIELFGTWNVSFVRGPVWTTDALYRETASAIEEKKKLGCIAVDMESSACQAWADFKGLNFYSFFYSADVLEVGSWDQRILMNKEKECSAAEALFFLALKVIQEVR